MPTDSLPVPTSEFTSETAVGLAVIALATIGGVQVGRWTYAAAKKPLNKFRTYRANRTQQETAPEA